MVNDPTEIARSTWAVNAGRPDQPEQPLNTPPALVSNYTSVEGYARSSGTSSWRAFETVLGGLEGGRAISFSSGMAAVTAVFDLLDVGSHIALPDDCYHGVAALVEAGVEAGRWTSETVRTADTTAWIESVARSDLLWLETPSNPLLEISDLPAICAARQNSCLIAVDNTFATPINQRPLEVGADISVHSATKFIGGHSDLLMGAAVTGPRLADRLEQRRTFGGATPGALEAFLATRGIRTLPLRLERAQSNAFELASRLMASEQIDRVRYPGLADDPGHELAKRTLDGFGAVVSFEVHGGARAADLACERIRLIRHATSLGGVESTMQRRGAIPGQGGLPDALIRISVGIEDVDDLWRDLSQALA